MKKRKRGKNDGSYFEFSSTSTGVIEKEVKYVHNFLQQSIPVN